MTNDLEYRRSRRVTAGVAVGLIAVFVVAIVLLATLAEGRAGTRSTSNDGGAWLVNQSRGLIGHRNEVVKELSWQVRIAPPPADFEVYQPAGLVAVHDRTNGRLILVDERQPRGGPDSPSISLPAQAEISEFDHGLVIVVPQPHRVWRFSSSELGSIDSIDEISPLWTLDASPQPQTAVSRSGAVATWANDGWLRSARPDSPPGEEFNIGSSADALTWDGDVLVGAAGQTLTVIRDVGEAPSISTSELPVEVAVFSQPTALKKAEVGFADPQGGLHTIRYDTSELQPAGSISARDIAPPILHSGCFYAVADTPPTTFRKCGDADPEVARRVAADTKLRIRLVNGWVFVNDISSGSLWPFDPETEPDLIDEWGADVARGADEAEQDGDSAAAPNLGENELTIGADGRLIRADDFDNDGVNEPPTAADDNADTHVDRPVIVDVTLNDDDPDGDVLLIQSLENRTPDAGDVIVTPDGTSVQVTPAAGFVGEIRFSYSIDDGRGESASALGIVTVANRDGTANEPPVPTTDAETVTAGESLIVNVLANDRDPEGDSLALISVSSPEGAVRFDASGQVIFTPDSTSEAGQVTLTYTVADDFGATAAGELNVAVRLAGSNQPPDARHDGGIGVVGRAVSLNILDNDTDPDGDSIFIGERPELISPPDQSVTTTTTSNGNFVFVPEQPGTYVFVYAATDGEGSDRAQIRIDVEERTSNRAPIAVRDDVTIPAGEERIVYVLTNDGDPDGDVVGIVDVDVPPDSGLSVNNFEGIGFRVQALPGAPSRASFRYFISDGTADWVSSLVVVAVSEEVRLNQPPLARPDVVEIRAGASVQVPVLENDFDPEGGSLRVVSTSTPDGATVRIGSAGQSVQIRVEPTTTSSFNVSYDVVDQENNRTASVIRVQIVGRGEENRPPTARPDIARTTFNDPVSIPVVANDSDPDGDPIRLDAITRQPAEGLAEVTTDGEVLFTPADGFSGTVTIGYSIVDAFGKPAGSEATVGVMPEGRPNRPPNAEADSFQAVATGGQSFVDVLQNDDDPDGDRLSVSSVEQPDIGAIEISSNRQQLVYVAPSALEVDSTTEFSYTVTDGRGAEATALVTALVQATPPDEGGVDPIAVDDVVGPFAPGETVEVAVLANDRDPDGSVEDLRVETFDNAAVVSGQIVTLVAPTQTSEYVYQITDSDLRTDTANIIVEVEAALPPVAVNDEFGPVAEGDSVTIEVLANDFDPDDPSGVLTVQSVEGAATVVNNAVVMVAPESTQQFDYTIADSDGLEATGTVSLVVVPNQAPQVEPYSIETDFETPVVVELTAQASDPDGDALLYLCCLSPSGGSPQVTSAGQESLTVEFTPNAGFSGQATFSYEVDDQAGHIVAGSVTVTVRPQPNRPPTTDGARASIQVPRSGTVSTTVDLAAVSDDPDGDQLLFEIASEPGSGLSASILGTILTISATENSAAAATTVGYEVVDPDGLRGAGQVDVEVEELENAAPVASGTAIEVPAGGSTNVSLPDFSSDNDEDDTLQYELIGGPSPGISAVLADNQVVVQATITQAGSTSSFEYKATDRFNESASAVVTITVVEPDLPPPTAQRDSARTTQSTQIEVAVLENDSDPIGDGLTVVFAESPDGAAEIAGEIVRFSPNDDFFGTATITYTIRDAADIASREATGTVTIEVVGRPSAPAPMSGTADARVVDLTWNTPANNGAPLTAYQLENDQGGTKSLGVANSYRWDGLTNATNYRFRVRAENEAGFGDWSEWSPVYTPDVVPERPSSPSVTHGDELLTVNWNTPTSDGSPIVGYEVRIGGGEARASAQTEMTWTSLTNGRDYTFQVRAENDRGWSEWSLVSTPEHPSTTPAAPGILPTTRAGLVGSGASGILEVRWTPVPVSADGGDQVTEYVVSEVGGSRSKTVPGAASSSVRFAGLPNGSPLRFTVTAVNRDGSGAASAVSDPLQACSVPSAPASISLDRGDRSATVQISASTNDGGCTITEYSVIDTSTGSVVATRASAGSTQVTSLENGRSYQLAAVAQNELGESPRSATRSVVPAGRPLCGTGSLSATPTGVGAVRLAWTAAAPNGRSISGYEIQIDSGQWISVGTNTSYTRTGLVDGRTYRFSYRAVNEVGASDSCSSATETTWGVPSQASRPALVLSGRNATATWSQPSANGSPITQYEVDPDPGASINNGTGLSRSFSNLSAGASLRVRTRACNAVGCGAWSAWSSSVSVSQPRVTLLQAAQGDYPIGDGQLCNDCWKLRTQLTGFSPNTDYTVVETASNDSNGWCSSFVMSIRTDGAGNADKTHECWYGFPGETVYLNVNGVTTSEVWKR